MAHARTHLVPYRRKRDGKTDYRKRLKVLVAQKPRVVIRKSLQHILVQIVQYTATGDTIIASAHSSELSKHGWKGGTGNVPASYLTGLLLAHKAKKSVPEAVVDIGLQRSIKGSRLFAAVKGLRDGGMKIPFDEKMLPSAERLAGKHIAVYAETLKQKHPEQYQKQFSTQLKSLDPQLIPKAFEDTKKKLMS